MKRKDVATWDETFMGMAQLVAKRSKDPSTQVGACIVDTFKRVVSLGYNGFPDGCSDDDFPWGKDGDVNNTKYPYVVHAELNAILNATSSVSGCTIYVSLFPCNECAKAIIQSGIVEVVYTSDKYAETDSVKASKRMFEASGVSTRQFSNDNITVHLTKPETRVFVGRGFRFNESLIDVDSRLFETLVAEFGECIDGVYDSADAKIYDDVAKNLEIPTIHLMSSFGSGKTTAFLENLRSLVLLDVNELERRNIIEFV